jgi:NADH:ubiquinone reductase (H+-translocating)
MSESNAGRAATPRIVIVGGGAGGLELATKLGKSLGRRGTAEVTLIDCSRTHIWKPLLHEVAAGTLDVNDDELDYLAQAHFNHFRFVLGRMAGLDRAAKKIQLAPVLGHLGEEIIPARTHPYDVLVIAVGSVSNDFGITGVSKHCLFLDTTDQAEQFQVRLLEAYTHVHVKGGVTEPGQLDVAIVGGGATGIELSAQLHQATRLLSAYGLDNVKPSDIRIHLIEASPRLLPGLPDRLSEATAHQLRALGIDLRLGEKVIEVNEKGVQTASGHFIPARIKVWAAGIKAPDFLRSTDLETNRINQLVVRPTLQTTRDDDIFALGDCAACPWPEKGGNVPPRAQSAHQQASLVLVNLKRKLRGEPLKDYRYTDYGSLVALGKFSTVGNLMGNLLGSVMIEGALARLVYLSLYKMHQLALFGPFRVGLLMIARFFSSRLQPKIKLH